MWLPVILKGLNNMFYGTAKYTKEMLEEYLALLKKNNITGIVSLTILLFLSVIVGVFIDSLAFFIAALFAFVLFLIIVGSVSVKKNLYASFETMHEPDVLFEFDDDQINISLKSEIMESKVSYKYSDFVNIVEGNTAMYLFIEGNQFFILDKRMISRDNLDCVRNRIYPSLRMYNFTKINHNKPLSHYIESSKNSTNNLITVAFFIVPIIVFCLLLASPIGSNFLVVGLFSPIGIISIVGLSYMYIKTKDKVDIIMLVFEILLTLVWFLFLVAGLK